LRVIASSLAIAAVVCSTERAHTELASAPARSPDSPVFEAQRGQREASRAANLSLRGVEWVVVAPHPDDEALLAAGVLLRAARAGERAAVIIVTNGDYDCRSDGLVREGESIRGLEAVGVPEEFVFFLGYPDGSLARLGKRPLSPVPRLVSARCERGNHTYGIRGHSRRDFHSAEYGAPAIYTAENAVGDLALLLGRLRPSKVVVTHPEDTHPDHAATYALVRRALDRVAITPVLLRGLVHNGDCWPTGTSAREPCPAARLATSEPLPPLSGRLFGYVAPRRIPVPVDCLSPSFDENPKLRAIAAHASQTRGDLGSYLFDFARSDEAFFPESLVRDADGRSRPARAAPGIPARHPDRLIRLRVPRWAPVAARAPSVAWSEENESSTRYAITVDPKLLEATLIREHRAERSELHRWPLPHDSWATGAEDFELEDEATSPDGAWKQLALYESGELVGVSVDVTPAPAPSVMASEH
jgi:LmbE family N-acetylglucosaminyl deacetylase